MTNIKMIFTFINYFKFKRNIAGSVFSYKLRYIVGFGLAGMYRIGFESVEMAISTNPKPTIYRNLQDNMNQSLI